MRFLFTQLSSGARRRRAPGHSSRRLSFEVFESRRTLCGDVTPLPDSPTTPPPTDPAPAELLTPESPPPSIAAPPPNAEGNQPPVITNFAARKTIELHGGTLWEISGQVADNNLANGVTLVFGGLFQGYTALADPLTGEFLISKMIPAGISGDVTGVAIDSLFAVSPTCIARIS